MNDQFRWFSATCLTSPCLVVLVVIATRHGRHQIWPIGREQIWLISGPGARYFSHLFHQVTPQIFRLDLQLEGAPPSGAGALCIRIVRMPKYVKKRPPICIFSQFVEVLGTFHQPKMSILDIGGMWPNNQLSFLRVNEQLRWIVLILTYLMGGSVSSRKVLQRDTSYFCTLITFQHLYFISFTWVNNVCTLATSDQWYVGMKIPA